MKNSKEVPVRHNKLVNTEAQERSAVRRALLGRGLHARYLAEQ